MLIAPRFDALEWTVGLLVLIILLGIFWHRRKRTLFLLSVSIFWVYILVLLNATVFPLPEYRVISNAERQYWTALVLSNMNLIPFRYGEFARFGYVFPEIMSNILLTVPFGFGLNFLTKVKPKNILWIGLALSTGIEFAQLIVDLRFAIMYHAVDVNDAIWNTLGVILGYVCFRLISLAYLRFGYRLGRQRKTKLLW